MRERERERERERDGRSGNVERCGIRVVLTGLMMGERNKYKYEKYVDKLQVKDYST